MKYQLYILEGEERFVNTWWSMPVSQKFVPMDTPQETLEDAMALAVNHARNQFPLPMSVGIGWTAQAFGDVAHQWLGKVIVMSTLVYSSGVDTQPRTYVILSADEIVGEQERGE